MNKKKIALAVGAAACVGIIALSAVLITRNQKEEEIVYRETTAMYGKLTVGISEDASVTIGTVEQTFDLDISALVSDDAGSETNASSPGGFGMGQNQNFGGMMSFGTTGTTYTSESQSMEVDEVYVTDGQEIAVGTPLFHVTTDSVEKIRTALEEDVSDTQEDYETLQVEQQQSRVQATQEYDSYVTNGKYASLVYDNTVKELQKAVDEAAETVDSKQNQLNENLLELSDMQAELVKAQQQLDEAQGAVSANYSTRYENAYYYTVYENTREIAQKLVDQLEENVESLTEENETLSQEIDAAVRDLNQKTLDLEKGKLDAKKTYDIDNYYSGAASEWYAIQTASLDNELQKAKDSYDDAVGKLDEFDSYIVDNTVLSEYSGVITQVGLGVGDSVSRNSSLVTLYDKEAVTMEVSLAEEDYNTIDTEGKVNISYTAYPDSIYTGTITEVSDAEYDSSSGEVYYTVTVTVQGDGTGLYEGMTGEVTFVTKETREVTYVSNRAIFREGMRSYAKVRDENGNVVEKDVTTGFSDGINVEIVEGLSEGDVVLIESKVSDQ